MNTRGYVNMRKTKVHEFERVNHEDLISQAIVKDKGKKSEY